MKTFSHEDVTIEESADLLTANSVNTPASSRGIAELINKNRPVYIISDLLIYG